MNIDANTEIYGVIGYPVRHSLSPVFQNAGFRHLGINAVYLAFEIPPKELKTAILGLKGAGVKGLNVTIPHKEAVLELCDWISEEVKEIGAVNTLKFSERIEGYNTDWIGFLRAVEEVESIKGKKVLLLGAGGSSKAIAYSLHREKVKVYIWNRTKEKAEKLAEKYGFIVIDRPEDVLEEVDMIVNTTSVGLKDDDPPLFDYSLLKPEHTVMDIIYKETLLVREAKKKGCRLVSGLSMLVHQGARSFEIWTGCKAPVKVMKRALGIKD